MDTTIFTDELALPRPRRASAPIRPYRLDVPDSALDDLRHRLYRTRWPEDRPAGALRQLALEWRDRFDWRQVEARLDEVASFRTEIDGADLHFLHVRSLEARALPLVFLHGWPGSILDLLELVAPLTQDRRAPFHVIGVSLPGLGFSGPARDDGWDVPRMARTVAALLTRLGYRRYAVHGGDLGAEVAHQLDGVVGVHAPRRSARSLSSSLAVAAADSPTALLAWLVEAFPTLTAGRLLTHASAAWLTGASLASAPVTLAEPEPLLAELRATFQP
jgi:microsomal epoxide hydrolase